MAVIAGPGVHRDGGHVSHLKGLVRSAKKNIQSWGGGRLLFLELRRM